MSQRPRGPELFYAQEEKQKIRKVGNLLKRNEYFRSEIY